MNFGLVRLVLGSSAFVPITEHEFNEIRVAKAALIEALSLEEKFDVVIENHLEFETCLLEATARHMLLRNQDYQWFQIERNLYNRRLLNLLSACRSYLDRSKHHVKAMMPENPAITQLNARLSHHYDNCLGYRVMEALRNFVQHRGFPIHAVSYPSRWLGDGDQKRLEFGLSPYIKTEYLFEDGQFKKSVLKELNELGGRVNLKPLVRDYISVLGDVHELIRGLLRPELEAWDKAVLGAIEKFQSANPKDDSVTGLAAVAKDKDSVMEKVELFKDLIEYRRSMQRKNCSLSKLRFRYVTSMVESKDDLPS